MSRGINTLAREAGLAPMTVHNRLKRGWSLERALSTPSRGRSADLAGRTFGALRVLSAWGTDPKTSATLWFCACVCNRTTVARAAQLLSGGLKSCGCRATATVHGRTNTPEYRSWRSLRSRCNNPKDASYALYGAMGITVCARWDDFDLFFQDMGPRPDGFSIDRIDPWGNYEPDNCRWATPSQQARNKRWRRRPT